MRYKGVIFDLDNTLLDTNIAKDLRKARKWEDVYSAIPYMVEYDGIRMLLSRIDAMGIQTCIVTTSPKSYAERVISYWKFEIPKIIAYRDTQQHKPDPSPIIAGLHAMQLEAKDVISLGDDLKDIIASNAAKVDCIACFWGTTNPSALQNCEATYRAYSAFDVFPIVFK